MFPKSTENRSPLGFHGFRFWWIFLRWKVGEQQWTTEWRYGRRVEHAKGLKKGNIMGKIWRIHENSGWFSSSVWFPMGLWVKDWVYTFGMVLLLNIWTICGPLGLNSGLDPYPRGWWIGKYRPLGTLPSFIAHNISYWYIYIYIYYIYILYIHRHWVGYIIYIWYHMTRFLVGSNPLTPMKWERTWKTVELVYP